MGKAEEIVNFSDEEDCADCPLCMEPLEIDDQQFFPCPCGYQICWFCWHRIRTNDNGLCPACRREYKEDPANFKPLTCEDIVRIKNEKKQRSLEKKQKMAESRKHLSDIRVLQRNLVFVTGIPPKLADVEILKKPEYFGRYGKIHKCVLNQQGPVATAYATYVRDEDAFKAVLGINGTYLQNNILRASLGTTKYCSYFLRHLPCPKQDCMYLHGLGDHAASFTKADMQAGKHQQYENIIFREYFSKKAETMKQNMGRPKMNTKDELCQNGGPRGGEAWCPSDILDSRTLRPMGEPVDHTFYAKTSLSDPDLSSGGTREESDWNEVTNNRRSSISSPSEDELDFDPWEISKDGLEELIQNQAESEPIPTASSVPQQPTVTTQHTYSLAPSFQSNFINHQNTEPFLFQSFQQSQNNFSPFSLPGLPPQQQQQQPLSSVDRLFSGHSMAPPPAQFKKPHPFADAPGGPFYGGSFEHQSSSFGDIRLHDPSILSTSPEHQRQQQQQHLQQQQQQQHQSQQQQPRAPMDMSSLQQGLQELFPHANVSFSDPFGLENMYGPPRQNNDFTLSQRMRQAPPGFQNVTPSYTNQLLCQQLQNENNVIKIQ